jgi:signal transduction histidine kinase
LLYALILTASEAVPFAGALAGQVINAVELALLSVPAWLLVVRRMDRAGWGWKLAVHALIAPLYAFAGIELYVVLVRWTGGPEAAAEISRRYGWIVLSFAVLYALQFALYHAVRFAGRLRQKEKQAAELAALARERELAALKAQVNPHFLFNALNSVSAAVRRDPAAARAMIEKLAGLLRYATGCSRGNDGDTLATLEDELAFARRYLALEGRRFGPDRLDARFDVDDAALDARLPPMTLQPLVENAVRHGIAPREDGGAVTVRASGGETGRVRVTVEDTGAGPNGAPLEAGALPNSADENGGTGLENTDARLRKHFGPEARLHAEQPRAGDDNTPRGFRIWFSIPTGREG